MIDSSDFRTKGIPLNHGLPYARTRLWHPDSRCSRDDKCYQGRAGSWISTLGRSTIPNAYGRACSRLLPFVPRMSPRILWSGSIATSRVSLSRLLIAAHSQNRCLPSP